MDAGGEDSGQFAQALVTCQRIRVGLVMNQARCRFARARSLETENACWRHPRFVEAPRSCCHRLHTRPSAASLRKASTALRFHRQRVPSFNSGRGKRPAATCRRSVRSGSCRASHIERVDRYCSNPGVFLSRVTVNLRVSGCQCIYAPACR